MATQFGAFSGRCLVSRCPPRDALYLLGLYLLGRCGSPRAFGKQFVVCIINLKML